MDAFISEFGLTCLGIFLYCLIGLFWLIHDVLELVFAIFAFVIWKILDAVLTVLRFRLRIFC